MADRTFEERLVGAMGKMVNPTKSSTATVPTKGGGKYTYKYETLDQVLAAVRPPLIEEGIGLTQRQVWSDHAGGYVLQTVVFDHENSLVMDERPIFPTADAQACGSFETYMRRYALRTAFGLAGEDDDGKAATESAKARPAKAEGKPKPDLRTRMLAEIAKLKAECMQNGVHEEGLDAWAVGSLGTADAREMDDAQLKAYGTYLRQMAADSREVR